MTLRLVDRGEPPIESDDSHRRRFRALRNIETAMVRAEARSREYSCIPSPIGRQALMVGAGVCLGLLVIESTAEAAGL